MTLQPRYSGKRIGCATESQCSYSQRNRFGGPSFQALPIPGGTWSMSEWRTARIRRGWLDRLQGFDRIARSTAGHSENNSGNVRLGFLAALERRISVLIGLINALLKRTNRKGYVKAKAANLLFNTRLAGRGLYLRVRKPLASFRVGFLIAGVSKAGTSSLYYLLQQHTNIGLSVVKEVKFFNDITVDWCNPNYNLYHRYFPCMLGKIILGEATPGYIYWPEALKRIKVYNPDMRLIFLFRDPIERAYSSWCHNKRAGRREPLTFAEAIRSGRARVT